VITRMDLPYQSRFVKINDPKMGALILRGSRIGAILALGAAFAASEPGAPPRSMMGLEMKEPGLDGRHRDQAAPKGGRIQQKRSDTLNENLPRPIPQFGPRVTLGQMREATGKVSEEAVRRAAGKL